MRQIDGRYELIEEIGSGGMGSVWRGYDAVLDRPVAIKTINLSRVVVPAQADEFILRFEHEARVTARIRHHGVPQVYDAVLDRGLAEVYLVMEDIDGTPLRNYINPDRPLPVSWAAAMAAQISTVLSYAHALPTVHRDLKPDNVLVTRDGAVKVIDFGIAAMLEPGSPKLTATGNPIGTPLYMQPERILGASATPRSDLYALGCILHEMLSGYPVFNGRDVARLFDQHVRTEPTPLREIRQDVPAELELLVLDLLRKDPAKRPEDAHAVYERLLPLLPPPGSEVSPTELYAPGCPDPTRVFRRPNAPLETLDRIATTRLNRSQLEPTAPLTADHLRTAIENAVARFEELFDAARFGQAAEVLGALLDRAGQTYGTDSTRVLDLRLRIATAHELGGEPRRAQKEFDSLADAYLRVQGRSSEYAWESRAGSVRCRMALGDVVGGLDAMRELRDEIIDLTSHGASEALDFRYRFAELLVAAGEEDAAREELEALFQDLELLKGPDDPMTQEVAGLLHRLLADETRERE